MAPNCPVLAPITATVLFVSAASSRGRDAQSIAFFRPPGTEPLYSGVANRIASASSHSARSRYWARHRALVEVLVVDRQIADGGRIEQLDLDALRGGLNRRAEELRVVRVVPEAAGDGQDPHR
jgi:hypothetical protein